MARMLGLTGDGGGTNLGPLIGRRRKQGNRIMRHREQRAVRREIERETAERGWAAQPSG